jgi:hypothetical protein
LLANQQSNAGAGNGAFWLCPDSKVAGVNLDTQFNQHGYPDLELLHCCLVACAVAGGFAVAVAYPDAVAVTVAAAVIELSAALTVSLRMAFAVVLPMPKMYCREISTLLLFGISTLFTRRFWTFSGVLLRGAAI